MEGIVLAGIIVPYIVSVVAGLTTDHALYDFVDNLRKKGKKEINHDLQKAVKRSFLSALQDIISECQNDVKWLDRKFKELAKELKQIEHSVNITPIFDSFNEIELLLRPTGGPAQEKIQAFEEKLVAVALKDHTALEYFKKKVEAELFQRMSDKFAKEIKYTPEVYHIFTATMLPLINQTLLANQKKLENIESLLQPFLTQSNEILQRLRNIENLLQPKYDKKVEITLGTDFDSLSLPELLEAIEKLQQKVKARVLRTEAGSIKLIFETTEEGAKELKRLDRKELSQILGIPVEDMRISDSLLQETAPFSLSETLSSVAEKLLEKLNALLENPFADWGLAFMKDEDGKAEKPSALIYAYGCRKDNHIIVLEESEENPDELKNDIRIIKSGKPYYLQSLVQNEECLWIGHGEKVKAETNIPLTIKDPGCESFILLMDQDNDALNESVNIIINALNSGTEGKVFSTTIIIIVEVVTGGIK